MWCVCADFSLPDTFLSAVKGTEVSVHADIHLQPAGQKHGAAHKTGNLTDDWLKIQGANFSPNPPSVISGKICCEWDPDPHAKKKPVGAPYRSV